MRYKLFFSILAIVLSVIQLINSNSRPFLYQSEIALVEQKQRMNEYPPRFYRVAHILEERVESRVLYKLQKNFFTALDIREVPFILVPLIFIGFFQLIQKKESKLLLFTLVVPLIVLTYLGPDQRIGNYCIYPFVILSSIYGIIPIFKK